MKTWLIAAVAVVVMAAAVVGVRVALEEPAVASLPASTPEPVAEAPAMQPVPKVVVGEAEPQEPAATEPLAPEPVAPVEPEDDWQPDPAAVESLRRSMEEGDPRAPPIARRETEREMPTEEELADPELYLQYETRQQQKVYASFLQASEKKISDLEKLIEQARAEGGVSPEQLEEGEEKLRGLQEMRDKLLQQYPELSEPETEGETPDDAP